MSKAIHHSTTKAKKPKDLVVSGVTPQFPSPKQHLNESWLLLTHNLSTLIKLLLIWIGVAGVSFLLVLLLLGTLSIDGDVLNVIQSLPQEGMTALTQLPHWYYFSFMAVAFFYLLFLLLASTTYGAALTFALGDDQAEKSPGQLIRDGFYRAPALIVLGVLQTFLLIGSFFFFFFPGIILTLFLTFAGTAVILDKKTPLQAIRQSFNLVNQQLGHVLARVLLFLFVYIGYSLIVQVIIGSLEGVSAGLFQIFFSLLDIVVSWLTLAYFIRLYQDTKAASDLKNNVSTWWAWLLACLGWLVLIILVGVIGAVMAQSGDNLGNWLTGLR